MYKRIQAQPPLIPQKHRQNQFSKDRPKHNQHRQDYQTDRKVTERVKQF